MDRSAVEAIVARELPRLARRLGVDHWHITTCCDATQLDDLGNLAECAKTLNYRLATIRFNPDRIASEAELIATIEHELLHLVLAPFDLLWEQLIGPLRGLRRQQAEAVWQFACESTITALERALKAPEQPETNPDDHQTRSPVHRRRARAPRRA